MLCTVPTVLTGEVEPNLGKIDVVNLDLVALVPQTIESGNRVVHAEALAPARLSTVHVVG